MMSDEERDDLGVLMAARIHLAAALAELVVWFGQEDTRSYGKRLDRARKTLEKYARDGLRLETVRFEEWRAQESGQ
jgi:hypothetical protein